jgi:hypothetical protein
MRSKGEKSCPMMAAHDDPGGSNGEILGFGAEKIVSVAED